MFPERADRLLNEPDPAHLRAYSLRRSGVSRAAIGPPSRPDSPRSGRSVRWCRSAPGADLTVAQARAVTLSHRLFHHRRAGHRRDERLHDRRHLGAFGHGRRHRLIITKTTGRRGSDYFYFLYRGRQEGYCDLPHLPMEHVEDAILRYWASQRLPRWGQRASTGKPSGNAPCDEHQPAASPRTTHGQAGEHRPGRRRT
jgi:hypothetical protein